VANSAIRVVGRLDPAEASRPEYGFLPPAQRQRALLAKPGTMFVSQPEIPVPLCVEFPFPSWATRPGEAGAAPSATLRSLVQSKDPFDVVTAGVRAGLSDDDIPF
jgi:DNA helicase HerA-like ATPase